MTKAFCWCSLNLENFWFYTWALVPWLNFTIQMTLCHFSYPCLWIKYLSAKITKYILKCWQRSVKRKSDINFRVIKKIIFWSTFSYMMVKRFLKNLWWWFLVPRSEHLLVSSETLLCKTENILTLSISVYYNTNSFFLISFLLMHWWLLACSSSMRLCEMHNALQLPVFFFSFFSFTCLCHCCQEYREIWSKTLFDKPPNI